MSFPLHNQQRVFLTYRSLFKGQTALVRKRKKIQQLVQTHQQSSKTLIKDLGLNQVVDILKNLLEKRIFSSDMKAKAAFPLVFQTTAVQDMQHAASEAGALEEEAREFERVKGLEMNGNVGVGENAGVGVNVGVNGTDDFDAGGSGDVMERDVWEDVEEGFVDHQIVNGDRDPPHDDVRKAQVPSLYPLYIPYRTQHHILTKVQRLLEEGCFEFSSKWTPDLLARKKWDCSEAIELNQWIAAMRKSFRKLPADALGNISGSTDVFCSVNKLRHSAVHRLRLTVRGIKDIIHKAMIFTATLRDTERESQLNELYLELQRTIQSLELHKNFLETRLQEEFDEIHRLRMELNKREDDAKARTLREDGENNSMAGSLLEESLRAILDKASQAKSPPGGEEDVDKTDGEEVSNGEPGPEHQHEAQVHYDREVLDEVPVEQPEVDTASVQEIPGIDVPDELQKQPEVETTSVQEIPSIDVPDELQEQPEVETTSVQEIPGIDVPDELQEQPEPKRISDQEIPDMDVPGEPEEEVPHLNTTYQKMNGQTMQESQDADEQPVETHSETWLDYDSPYQMVRVNLLPIKEAPLEGWPENPVQQEEAYPEEIQQEEPEIQPDSPGYKVSEAFPLEQPPEEVLSTLPTTPPPPTPPIGTLEQAIEPEVIMEQEAEELVPAPPPEWLAQRLRQQAINGNEGIDGSASASAQDARILLQRLVDSITAVEDFKVKKRKGKGKSSWQAKVDDLMEATTDIWGVLSRPSAGD